MRLFPRDQQYRLALCGHKAVEAGAVCLVLMVQGDLTAITLAHLVIATKTGLLAVVPAIGVTFTKYVRHLLNRWTASAFLAVCTFAADAAIHASHYPGEYTEAALTCIGAFFFSLVVSYTPIGKKIDQLGEAIVDSR
jgi:integral membrane sensor domain MASE1